MNRLALCIAFSVLLRGSVSLHAQNPNNQQVRLKDPTPREVDLEKKLGVAPADAPRGISTDALVEYNRRRQELVARASNQVFRLAETLHKAFPQHKPESSWKSEREVVSAIQSLASNIRVALTPPASRAQQANGTGEMPLTNIQPALGNDSAEENAAKLLVLATDLKDDAVRTGPDMIALRSIRDAEQITALTLRLNTQLQP